MASCRGYFQGTLCPFLPFHVAQIPAGRQGGDLPGLARRQGRLAREMLQELQKRLRADDLTGLDPGRLRTRGLRADEPARAFRGSQGGGQGARDRNQRAIERQFPQRHRSRHRIARQDFKAERRLIAMARSKCDPSFGRSAGDRLTVIRFDGSAMESEESAVRTRSFASDTALSGRPTMEKAGRPGVTAHWT